MPAPRTEPRLPAIIALLAVGGIYTALPPFLTLGPRWLLLAVVGVLLIPTVVSLRTGHYQLNRVLGYVVSAVITLAHHSEKQPANCFDPPERSGSRTSSYSPCGIGDSTAAVRCNGT